MILLGASCFAVSAFGVNQCTILIHKAGTTHLIQNTQRAWNRSITETSDELTVAFGGKSKEETDRIEQNKANQTRWAKERADYEVWATNWRATHPKEIEAVNKLMETWRTRAANQ